MIRSEMGVIQTIGREDHQQVMGGTLDITTESPSSRQESVRVFATDLAPSTATVMAWRTFTRESE